MNTEFNTSNILPQNVLVPNTQGLFDTPMNNEAYSMNTYNNTTSVQPLFQANPNTGTLTCSPNNVYGSNQLNQSCSNPFDQNTTQNKF